MAERGDAAAGAGDLGQVDVDHRDAGISSSLREDLAPGRHRERMAPGLAGRTFGGGMNAALSRREDEAAGLDGAGAQENLPMGLRQM